MTQDPVENQENPFAGGPADHVIEATPVAEPKTSLSAVFSLVLGLSSFVFSILTGLPAIILGIIAHSKIGKSRNALTGGGLATAGIVTGAVGCLMSLVLIGMLLPAVQQVRAAARRAMAINNSKQLVLGLLNYESAYQQFPLATDEPGQGLSWRVHILPFLDEGNLYNQFHLDEPWDTPHNLSLVEQMPEVFKSATVELPPGQTCFQMPMTPAALAGTNPKINAIRVQGEPGIRFGDITDGASNTILVIEASPEAAATWTDPAGDFVVTPGEPITMIGGHHHGVFITTNADGSSETLPVEISQDVLHAKITRAGGERIMPVNY